MKTTSIETPRLTLAPLVEEDAPELFRYRSDPEISRFQSWAPESVRDALRFIRKLRNVELDTPGSWYQLAIRLRARGALIGDVGLHFLSAESRQVELGLTVSRPYQRRGYGREAARAVLGHLFDTLGKHRVFASVDPRNLPSLALLKGIGMRQEAHFVRSLWFKGEWADDVVWAMLREEWSSPSARERRGAGSRGKELE